MVVRRVADLGELSDAEKVVLAELDAGEDIVLGDGVPEADDEARHVCAALIRLLLLGDDPDPKYRLHEKGLRIRGAWIPDRLDLEGCRGLRDVGLMKCRFGQAPLLRSAELRNLSLSGSRLPGLAADRLEVGGEVLLRDGFEATGGVRLLGAKLGGNLDCTGAKFRAEKDAQGNPGLALSADRLEARGGVFLGRVKGTGAVRLVGAKIGGDLYCDGASFRSEKDAYGKPGMALSAYGARISGGLFLKEGASLAGVLDLTAAEFGTINDDPQCWPGKGDLVLNRCRYGAFVGHAPVDAKSRLAWLGRQDATDFRPQPYQQLASVLREMGHDDAAKTVLVAKERARRAAELRRMAGWRKPLHWVWTQLLRMVGYGYRPALAFVPALAVVLVGWGVIDRAAGAGLLLPAKRAEAGAPAAALMPLAYSFEAFVPVVTLGQVEAFRPDMGTRWGRRLQIYLWLHGLAGWLIGGIAAAGVLGLFRRE